MILETPAIICGVRLHGEHGAIVRVLTPEHGLLVGYVRGSRSRTMRPILIPANLVEARFSARSAEQLAGLSVELSESRAGLMVEPLAAEALGWITALTATALPEAHPYPAIHSALDGVICAIAAAPSARRWAGAVVQYEALLIRQLGYAASDRLIAPDAEWAALLAGFEANRKPMEKNLLTGNRADILAARERLIERLARAR